MDFLMKSFFTGSTLVIYIPATFMVNYSLIQPIFASLTSHAVTHSSNWLLYLSLSVCLSGDEGENAEKSQDSPAKEKEAQAEGS